MKKHIYFILPFFLSVSANHPMDGQQITITHFNDNQHRHNHAAFMHAASMGESGKVASFIDLGVDINKTGIAGNTVLIEASRWNHKAIVKLIIKAEADLNQPDGYGCTALMHAIRQGHIDIVRIFINSGADLNTRNTVGDTAIQMLKKLHKKQSISNNQLAILAMLKQAKKEQLKKEKRENIWKNEAKLLWLGHLKGSPEEQYEGSLFNQLPPEMIFKIKRHLYGEYER